MDKAYKARNIRRALELFVQTLTDETIILEVAEVYPKYEIDKLYKIGYIFRYGFNVDGESQLYQVLQEHTTAAEWTPDTTPSLYKKIGFTDSGISIWTQPLGATDAYAINDIVMHNEVTWKSTIDNNVWEPGVYGWVQI